MKKILSLFFIFIVSKSFAIVGLADWQCKTNSGEIFDNYSGNGITLFVPTENDVTEIKDLSKWYFYKDYIIGENFKNNKVSYFFVSQKSKKIFEFEFPEAANKFRDENNLEPAIWTRWYNDDFQSNVFLFLFNCLIAIFLIYKLVSITFKIFKKRKIHFEKNEISFYKILLLIFIILTFFDSYKDSF